ncbi:MAG: hypothetical protein ACOY4R_14245 [Pseudomonadota bacterium]
MNIHEHHLALTEPEHRALTSTGAALSMIVGRPVSPELAVRLALRSLLPTCSQALKEPAKGRRVRAELIGEQAERELGR